MRFRLHGSVQGIGFRPWVARIARELGVSGRVANAPDGAEIDAFGRASTLEMLRDRLMAPPLPGARVDRFETFAIDDASKPAGFTIAKSTASGSEPRRDGMAASGSEPRRDGVAASGSEVSVAPDLPTCDDCLAELADPRSRRHRYPFIACAHCGPRYTLVRGLPWDRERTAMHDFPLCPACAREYGDPSDRRHHAEATCCPACGPTLCARRPGTREIEAQGEAALAQALAALRAGGIVAVRGVGGFHLACDASDEAAVRALRARKRRPGKPFAVMMASLAEVEKHVLVDADARRLLGSEARPIVLLRRRDDSDLAPSLAPGSPMLGVMLGHAPIHALLLHDFAAPLVMTSANRSGEPLAHRAGDAAVEALADLVLDHDREIVAPCDDSVATAAPDGPIWLRRARGHAPRPLRLGRPLRHAVLALGGHWSNTICVARGDQAWPSAHVGDIESPESVARLESTVRRWLDWLGVSPEVVAHDLHPGYESTRLAQGWRDVPGVRVVGVQHHHAHLAAVLGEHGVDGPALGLVWDGTGAGPDGSAWGGELLLGDARSVRRLATFRPIALAGGDQAIREPWRLAWALVRDAFGDEQAPGRAASFAALASLGLFEAVPPAHRERVTTLLDRKALCPSAHGVGRYFDAVGALLLARPRATYQGELAQALCFTATGRREPAYAFEIDSTRTPWQIDLRPAVRALVGDIVAGASPHRVADRFHATLVAAGSAAVAEARRVWPEARAAERRVVLAGGCFANAHLVSGFEHALGGAGSVLRARDLPPGDGGLSFGQALVADGRALVADGRVLVADAVAAGPEHEEED